MDARLDLIAHRASRAVAARHRGFTTPADMYQEAWSWLLTHPARVAVKLDPAGHPYPTLLADVRAHLERIAQVDRSAGNPWTLHQWSPSSVRAALREGALWSTVGDTLPVADVVLLRDHYGNSLPWSEVAARTGVTEQACRVRASRAVAALCVHLNRR